MEFSSSTIGEQGGDISGVDVEGGLTMAVMSSEDDKSSKILMKTLNAKEYIESNIQNIQVPIMDDHII